MSGARPWLTAALAVASVASCAQLLKVDAFGPAGAGGAGGVSSGGGGTGGAGGTGPRCGDGVKNGDEACDANDLAGLDCVKTVAPGWEGVLDCNSKCQLDPAGCHPPETKFNEMTVAANWELFDVGSKVSPSTRGFIGAVFDGKYMYFVPHYNGGFDGVVARFDTTLKFGEVASWTYFDVATVNPAARGFFGGAFDGRYVYLLPEQDGPMSWSGVVARYDTQAAFDSKDAWGTFDMAAKVSPAAKGYAGAAFDGRYLYLSPWVTGATAPQGLMVRYDTRADFAEPASWKTFDAVKLNASSKGFHGAAFDGRYVYYVPYTTGTVTRYDTQAPFESPGAWSVFDLTSNFQQSGFAGSAFDGRYLYLAQFGPNGTPSGVMMRYDTTLTFTAASSWEAFDLATVNPAFKGYHGMVFDGRYVYAVPHYVPAIGFHGLVARFDTTAPKLAQASAWTVFNLQTLSVYATGFVGGAYDGRYLYLAPLITNGNIYHGIVPRFDTKSPPWLPKLWNASFF
jgi:hypothetical protein